MTVKEAFRGMTDRDTEIALRDVQRRTGATQPVWEDLTFPSVGLNPPGAASDPGRDTTNGMLTFAKAATNILAGHAQIRHRWKIGTDIEAHIHWYAFTDPGATPDVVWKLEYEVVAIGGSWDGSTYSNSAQVTAEATAQDKQLLTELDTIDMSAITTVSAHIHWKLSRLGGDAADDYDAVAHLGDIDFHYQSDGLGSEEDDFKRLDYPG